VAGRQVLVVGGTGFLGRRLAEAFVAEGDEVSVLSRGQGPEPPRDVRHIAADRHQPASLAAALRGIAFDVVVDNVAFSGQDVADLLTALGSRGGVGHYLLTSSAAVYANLQVRRPLREPEADLSLRLPRDAPDAFHTRLGQDYANGKREAETVLRDSGLAWTSLRAPIVVGPDDRTLRIWWFVQRLLDGGPILIPDWGPGRLFQVVWTHDFARACALAASNPAAFGRAYNVAQAEVFTAETWLQALAEALGRTVRFGRVPEQDLAARGLPEYHMPIAGRPFGHVLLDGCAARADLGFEPLPESAWLRATAQGCAANPPSQPSAGYARRAEEMRAAVA
jgi:nucleoside-diphosphate-sugar epimerase